MEIYFHVPYWSREGRFIFILSICRLFAFPLREKWGNKNNKNYFGRKLQVAIDFKYFAPLELFEKIGNFKGSPSFLDPNNKQF